MAKTSSSSKFKYAVIAFFLLLLPVAVFYASSSQLNDSRSSAHSTIGESGGGLQTIKCLQHNDCKIGEYCMKDGANWNCKSSYYVDKVYDPKTDTNILSWPDLDANKYEVYGQLCYINEKGKFTIARNFTKLGETKKTTFKSALNSDDEYTDYNFQIRAHLKNGKKLNSEGSGCGDA